MAKVKSSDGKIIVVARYRPPGNVINHFQENVNPKVKTVCWSFCSDSFYWQRCRDVVKRSMTAIYLRQEFLLLSSSMKFIISELNYSGGSNGRGPSPLNFGPN